MEPRARLGGGAGGGEGIAQARQPLARLTVAAGAFLAGTGFALWACWPALSPVDRRYLPAIAIAALLLLAVGLLAAWVGGLAWGVALLGATFLLRLQLDPTTAAWTPVAAACLLGVAELGYWSYELESGASFSHARPGPRLLLMAVTCIAAALFGDLVLNGVTLLPSARSWSIPVAAGAVGGLLAILLWLSRRPEPSG